MNIDNKFYYVISVKCIEDIGYGKNICIIY